MNREHAALIERIGSSGKDLLSYVAQLSDDELRRTPGSDDWSVHAVLAHLRDVERHVFLNRIRRILNEEYPALESFDQEQWNRDHYSAEEPLEDIVAEYESLRQEEIQLLRNASAEDWTRRGVHPEYGNLSVEWLALHNYAHTLDHLHQMLVTREQALLQELNS